MPKRYSKLQIGLVSMACLIFSLGLVVSVQTFLTNHAAASQVAALSKQSYKNAATGSNTVPSTQKPSDTDIANYTVGPSMPRYLNIPELGVHTRVLSLGLLSSGSLATPNNIYDVGWYNASSKPGEPGAMLIDGHVSSWTSEGVFYGIKNLKVGEQLQVQKGDGTLVDYQVVKSQVFSSNNVDMTSAVTSVDPTKPGLNLITCAGDVLPGTNEFSQRIIVYAEQI